LELVSPSGVGTKWKWTCLTKNVASIIACSAIRALDQKKKRADPKNSLNHRGSRRGGREKSVGEWKGNRSARALTGRQRLTGKLIRRRGGGRRKLSNTKRICVAEELSCPQNMRDKKSAKRVEKKGIVQGIRKNASNGGSSWEVPGRLKGISVQEGALGGFISVNKRPGPDSQ